MRDKEKIATFSGNVQVVQGDTIMKCKTLVVFYETDGGRRPPARPVKTSPAVKAPPGMPQGAQSVSAASRRAAASR